MNVDRLASRLWLSPMSERTAVNQPIALPLSAGRCRPHRAISAHSPVVLSATVLPPALGPEMSRQPPATTFTSLATHRRPARSISGWRACSRSTRGAASSTGAAAISSSARIAALTMTSRAPAATIAASKPSASSATQPDSRAKMRRSSSATSHSASFLRLLRSTISSGSMKIVAPLCDVPWTMPFTKPLPSVRTGST